MTELSTKWQQRFMKLAYELVSWSSDRTKVGAVIVGSEKNIISTGYNGFPKGVLENDLRKSPEYKAFFTCHAEQNAIDLAKSDLNGAILVTTHEPCAQCARSIIQKGIKTVYFCESMDNERWYDSLTVSRLMLNEAGVKTYQINLEESSSAEAETSTTKTLSMPTLISSECGLKTTVQLSTEPQQVQIRWEARGPKNKDSK
jgi:dCMP deaminase